MQFAKRQAEVEGSRLREVDQQVEDWFTTELGKPKLRILVLTRPTSSDSTAYAPLSEKMNLKTLSRSREKNTGAQVTTEEDEHKGRKWTK